MLTDEEKQNWDNAMRKANRNYDLQHGDPEESFKTSFIQQGHSPEKAAQMAKTARDGPNYERSPI